MASKGDASGHWTRLAKPASGSISKLGKGTTSVVPPSPV